MGSCSTRGVQRLTDNILDRLATNLRTGRRKPKAVDNAPAVRERRMLHWTPLCREAVEDVVGEALDTPGAT